MFTLSHFQFFDRNYNYYASFNTERKARMKYKNFVFFYEIFSFLTEIITLIMNVQALIQKERKMKYKMFVFFYEMFSFLTEIITLIIHKE